MEQSHTKVEMIDNSEHFDTPGFAKNNKRTKRGASKHQVCFVPLQLRASDQKTILWKNKKPNSNRQTKILRSEWVAETSEFIVESHNSLEAEIKNLQSLEVEVDGVKILVNFEVLNCMNDGKVLHAVATQHYKREKMIPEASKSLSFQVCHLCNRSSKDFQKDFHHARATIEALKPLGFAPLHCAKNSRECILRSAFRKSAMTHFGKKDAATVKMAQNRICEKLSWATGARLFDPEPEKKGNSNNGENLKLITQYPEKTAKILDCCEFLAFVVHTKSKIWVVSAEIGLLETLSRCSMLNKCVCRIAMILWRVLPLLIFNN